MTGIIIIALVMLWLKDKDRFDQISDEDLEAGNVEDETNFAEGRNQELYLNPVPLENFSKHLKVNIALISE